MNSHWPSYITNILLKKWSNNWKYFTLQKVPFKENVPTIFPLPCEGQVWNFTKLIISLHVFYGENNSANKGEWIKVIFEVNKKKIMEKLLRTKIPAFVALGHTQLLLDNTRGPHFPTLPFLCAHLFPPLLFFNCYHIY